MDHATSPYLRRIPRTIEQVARGEPLRYEVAPPLFDMHAVTIERYCDCSPVKKIIDRAIHFAAGVVLVAVLAVAFCK